MQLARHVVTDTAGHHAVGVTHGLAGLGKTFAMRTCTAALAARTRPAERIEIATIAFPSRPTMRLLADLLLQTLTGAPPARQANRCYLTAALVRELARVSRLVVVDEAQRLPGGVHRAAALPARPRRHHRLHAEVDDELLQDVDDKFARGTCWPNAPAAAPSTWKSSTTPSPCTPPPAMPADPLRVMVGRDPHDTPDTRDLLAQIDNLDRGVLVVRPVPGTASPAVLALAVLAALGKQVEPRPHEPQRQWWRLARAWMVGHQVDHLVVDRAHTVPGKLIRDLIGLAVTAGAAGRWFIDASPKRIAPVLTELDAVTERPRQLLNLTLVEPDKPPSHHDHGRHRPPVLLPHTGFLYFRDACQQQLAVADAALVGFAWEHAHETMEQWLRSLDLFAYDRPSDLQLFTEAPRLTPMLSAQLVVSGVGVGVAQVAAAIGRGRPN